MAKQQFTFTLSESQVREAILEYASRMVDRGIYDIAVNSITFDHASVTATKRRARKAKQPKVAAMPRAAD